MRVEQARDGGVVRTALLQGAMLRTGAVISEGQIGSSPHVAFGGHPGGAHRAHILAHLPPDNFGAIRFRCSIAPFLGFYVGKIGYCRKWYEVWNQCLSLMILEIRIITANVSSPRRRQVDEIKAF